MRYFYLACIAATLCSSGCSALVARSGTDPTTLTTREEVHKQFGEPRKSGENYEEYRSHAKVAENTRAAMIVLVDYCTLGLGEVVLLPSECGRAGWKTLCGYDLRFEYYEHGGVKEVTVDGVPAMPWPFAKDPKPSP